MPHFAQYMATQNADHKFLDRLLAIRANSYFQAQNFDQIVVVISSFRPFTFKVLLSSFVLSG